MFTSVGNFFLNYFDEIILAKTILPEYWPIYNVIPLHNDFSEHFTNKVYAVES